MVPKTSHFTPTSKMNIAKGSFVVFAALVLWALASIQIPAV